MRIRIAHKTVYRYDRPVRMIQQILRLTPRSHEGQHVVDWRIDCNIDCLLRRGEDAFGNITHSFFANGPIDFLEVTVDGQIETFDTAGVVRGTVERFPPIFFLRESELTRADGALRAFARETAGGDIPVLQKLHDLMNAIHTRMKYDMDPTHAQTTAQEAFRLGSGVCQDFAHVFIACARSLDIPARYAGGHFLRSDGATDQDAGHAWVEAFVPDLGWVGFDPTHEVCVGESHVRVAIGPDYLSAAPVRGQVTGGGGENLDVSVTVSQVLEQVLAQRQN